MVKLKQMDLQMLIVMQTDLLRQKQTQKDWLMHLVIGKLRLMHSVMLMQMHSQRVMYLLTD